MPLLLHVFLRITHRHPGEDRKSIISERPKATLFLLPLGKYSCRSCSSISPFLQRDWETWLCLRSLIALEVMPALWSFLRIMARQLVFWVRQQKIMCTTPWGYSCASVMVAQGWLGTGVRLKTWPVHRVAPLGPFSNILPQTQWIPISVPLRCSFWPRPPKWFTWSPVSDDWLWTGLAEPPAHEGALGQEEGPISALSSSILLQSHFRQDTCVEH